VAKQQRATIPEVVLRQLAASALDEVREGRAFVGQPAPEGVVAHVELGGDRNELPTGSDSRGRERMTAPIL
jgi:hypothetical protein